MLKLRSNQPPPETLPDEIEEPVEEAAEEPPMDLQIDEGMSVGTVDPMVARYLGPESRCGGCIHFMDPGSCEIVAGPIAPDGVCSLFTPDEMAEPMIDESLPTEVMEE